MEYISIAKIELIALYQVGDIVRFGLIFFDNFDRKICTIGFLDDYDKANYKTGSIDQAIEVINTILPKNRNIRIVDKKQFLGIMPK